MSEVDGLTFWTIVRDDLHRYTDATSLRAMLGCYWNVPGFKYTFWMRLASSLRRKSWIWRPWYYVCRAILHWHGLLYGISIPYNTRIGPARKSG